MSAAEATVEAGQPLEVTVRFAADRPTEVTGGQVELVRHGMVAHAERGWMGAGATVSLRRSAVLDRADVDPAGPLVAGQHLVRSVTLAVPAGEASVDGYLVQQAYAVRARLDVSHGRGAEAGTAVRVTSRAAERSWVADTTAVVDDAGVAVLGIEDVTGRRLSGGVPLTGTVTVTPCRTGRARGVRVELVLAEQVPARSPEMPLEEDRAATTVVATAAVAGPLDLEPGAVLRLPFTLRPPLPLPAPSISAPEFTLRWLLRAVVDRPRRPDPTTTLELWAATAP
ncbi:hypothetical protein [Geodermatophilus saharensis]|uniref:hypothetical protein n=1 Tax=Geodermatophilus saharensis TaxID=1137994 RepID=UPI00113FCFF1|nr:hypothetical protein [Geodermatophilus saharensis]